MTLPKTTITIKEEKNTGWIQIKTIVERKNGQSEIGCTIKEYSIGRKVESVTERIREILKDIQNDL